MRIIHSLAIFAALLWAIPEVAKCDNFCGWGMASATLAEVTTGRLSDTQADACVRKEMEDSERLRDAQVTALKSADIIETTESNIGGRKIIVNRVNPPSAESVTRVATAALTKPLSDAEMQALRLRFDPSTHVSMVLFGTVYDNQVTELNWSEKGNTCRAFINADLKYLGEVVNFKLNDTLYSFILTLGSSTREAVIERNQKALSEKWPNYEPLNLPVFSNDSTEDQHYIALASSNSKTLDEKSIEPINALLVYFRENEATLRTAYQQRKALQEAKLRYINENPQPKADTIINFSPTPESKSLQHTR